MRKVPKHPRDLRLGHKNFHASHQNMDQNLLIGLVVLAVVVVAIYAYAPKIRSLLSGAGIEMFAGGRARRERFDNQEGAPITNNGMIGPGATNESQGGVNAATEGSMAKKNSNVASSGTEEFADYADINSEMGPVPMAPAKKPQGCFPREQINPADLLPADSNGQWAQANPQGAGDIHGKNFLSAGALIGINTIGQSLRNANLQLRAEPPCPQVKVSPWMNTTIEPDLGRRPLE